MSTYPRGKYWWYRFRFAGERIDEPTKSTSRTVAKEAERQHRRALEAGYNNFKEVRQNRVRILEEIIEEYLTGYRLRYRSASFAEYALGHVSRLLGTKIVGEITEISVLRYQEDRLREKAAPKSINEEVRFLLKMLGDPGEVILDEFAPFAYPGFTQVLQTARGARVSFLFSFQSMPQLQRVSQASADEVSSAPGTKMIMNVSEENTAQWFLKASARIATKRRSLSVRRTGIFSTNYTETGTGSESDIKETRAREDHIKNLPVGQMEILMVDNREGTRYSHLHVRRAPRFQVEGLEPSLYPKMHSYLDPEVGVNLRFKEAENRKQRRRRTAGLYLGEASGQ